MPAFLKFIAEPDGALVQLGEGAHGVVYLAKLTDMYVAVKVRSARLLRSLTFPASCKRLTALLPIQHAASPLCQTAALTPF